MRDAIEISFLVLLYAITTSVSMKISRRLPLRLALGALLPGIAFAAFTWWYFSTHTVIDAFHGPNPSTFSRTLRSAEITSALGFVVTLISHFAVELMKRRAK